MAYNTLTLSLSLTYHCPGNGLLHALDFLVLGMHEVGVIERYAAIISTLDSSLDSREGDDFLGWLQSQNIDISCSAQEGCEPPRDAAEGVASGHGARVEGDGKGEAGARHGERARVETFLGAAAERLNVLVADQEDALFRDRGERLKGKDGEEDRGVGVVEGGVTTLTNMTEEELYQVRFSCGCCLNVMRSQKWPVTQALPL